MKKIIISFLSLILLIGCVKEDQVFKTYDGYLIYSFLQKDSTYSEFVKIINKAGLKGMLSAYGDYTCLAPTNDAFRKYYKLKGANFKFENLTQGQVDTIARTHIVINRFLVADQHDGVLSNLNMDRRVIEIKFTTHPVSNRLMVMLNDSSEIISRDNEVYNGVVQGLDRVLASSNAILPDLISKNPQLSLFYEALKLTHWDDSLVKIKDENYHPTKVLMAPNNLWPIINPVERKYGYTAFVESNATFNKYGINTINDLIAKAKDFYPCDPSVENNFSDKENSLNKFIAYHLIKKAVYYNTFFYTRDAIKDFTPDEFLESMLENRIIRASRVNGDVVLNAASSQFVIIPPNASKTTINGVYHVIDKIMLYNDAVEKMLLNTRIRFDVTSLFPEMTNNNIRGSVNIMTVNNGSGDLYGFEPGYLKDIEMSKDTRLVYLAGKVGQWANFQSDELMGLGAYDITMRLLPVPPGTYELRFGYSANASRSVTQIYLDNKPIGIPLDLRILSSDPRIGFIADKATDDNGFENDKTMRNRGYMKAPNTYMYGNTVGRDAGNIVRRIIGTFTFTDYQPHYLRFKSVLSDLNKQCMMDYLEFVPKNVYSPANGEPESRD